MGAESVLAGLRPGVVSALIQAGADMLAIVSGVFAKPDIRAAAQAYSNLFHTGGPTR